MTLLSYSASTALLAYDSVALRVGMVVGALVFPVLGLILLIIGLVERSKANRPRPPYVPGYPGHPVPPSYPGYPHRRATRFRIRPRRLHAPPRVGV